MSKALVNVTNLNALAGSNTVDLREFLNARHGQGGWTQRTAPGLGTDIGPAMNDALDVLRARGGRGTLIIPPGGWRLVTPPNQTKLAGHTIEGYGSQASVIYFDAGSGVVFQFDGSGGYTGGGLNGLGIVLEDGYAASTVYAVLLQGSASNQPDQTVFNDLYITALGASRWFTGFQAYGNDRTSPQGIRVVMLSNIQIFACRNLGAYFSSIVQWSIDNLGVYAGSATGNNIQITGGGATNTNSAQFTISRLLCSGDLSVLNCRDFDIHGRAATAATGSSATYGRVWLHLDSALTGTPPATANWTIQT